MLYNYKTFNLLENNTENLIKKYEDKIRKFLNINFIVNYIINLTTNDKKTTIGLKFSVWIANQIKQLILNEFNIKNIDKLLKGQIKDDKFEKDIKQLIERYNTKINYILDYFKNPLRNEKLNLKELDIETAYKKSDEWHNSLTASGVITDETGNILIEFDDGYYWIDLQSTYCEAEARAMGHCGTTNAGNTLLSLRDEKKEPHITVAFDNNEGIIYQMKGKNNKKPVEKYYKYIYRLLVDPNIKLTEFNTEYNLEEDFNLADFDKETFDKVFEYNPDLLYNSIMYNYKLYEIIKERNIIDKYFIEKFYNNEKSLPTFFTTILSDDIDSDKYDIIIDTLKNLFKKNKVDLDNNTAYLIISYQLGLIGNDYMKNETGMLIKDNLLYLSFDKNDIETCINDNISTILFEDNIYSWYYNDYYNYDITKYSENYTDEIYNKLKELLIEHSPYFINDNEYILTEENFSDDNKTIIIDNNNFNILTFIDNFENDEIKQYIQFGIHDAQDIANIDEYVKKATEILEENISSNYFINFDKKGNKIYYFDYVDIMEKYEENVYDYIKYECKDYYGNIDLIDYNESIYIIINEVISDNDENKTFNDRYGLYGDINIEFLNERILDKLDEI